MFLFSIFTLLVAIASSAAMAVGQFHGLHSTTGDRLCTVAAVFTAISLVSAWYAQRIPIEPKAPYIDDENW